MSPDSFLATAFSLAPVHLSAVAVPALRVSEATTIKPRMKRCVEDWSMDGASCLALARRSPSEDRKGLRRRDRAGQLKSGPFSWRSDPRLLREAELLIRCVPATGALMARSATTSV